MKSRQRPAEAAPNTDLARYRPRGRPVPVRDSKPRTPNPGTPDQARMLPGANVRLETRVTNRNTTPRKLYAKGGAMMNKPGVTGSPVRKGKLT